MLKLHVFRHDNELNFSWAWRHRIMQGIGNERSVISVSLGFVLNVFQLGFSWIFSKNILFLA